MNEIIQLLSHVNPFWIYVIIFLITFIENIFPPSPSDVIVVFAGALCSLDKGNFWLALNFATLGSTLGFVAVFTVGNWFGKKILETGKLKFFPKESVIKMEAWFTKYGYWLIVVNRFLAGTRAVVSFFAGISHLEPYRTTVLSLVSSLLWYAILIYAGYSLGNNWEKIHSYLDTYSFVITGIVLLTAAILLIRYFINKRKTVRNV